VADVLTGGGSGQPWDLLVEMAFDRSIEYYLRDMPQWRAFIDKHPVEQAMPGDTVTLTIHNTAMALATTPLSEITDATAVAMPTPTRVSVNLAEYGNAAIATLRLKVTGFTRPDREMAELLGRNQYDTTDALVKAIADGGTNILFVNGGATKSQSNGGVITAVAQATDFISRNPATAAVKLLQRRKAMPKVGESYLGVLHPDVAFDLMNDSSATSWNAPHTVGGDTENIYAGVIGRFQGADYVQTTRTTIAAGAGAAGTNVYTTYYMGRGAIVEATGVDFHTVVGPQVDKLKRMFPLGWYGMAGWSIYRQEALQLLKTSSTINLL
jgi:N4-gp56 family major capsid protein